MKIIKLFFNIIKTGLSKTAKKTPLGTGNAGCTKTAGLFAAKPCEMSRENYVKNFEKSYR